MDTPLKPREVIQQWIEASNRHDAAAAAALYHDNASNLQIPEGQATVGRFAIKAGLAYAYQAFPDTVLRPLHIVEEGEWVIVEWESTGSWRGEFAERQGNGSFFKTQGCAIFQIVDGKIKLQRGYWDKCAWYTQLGIPLE